MCSIDSGLWCWDATTQGASDDASSQRRGWRGVLSFSFEVRACQGRVTLRFKSVQGVRAPNSRSRYRSKIDLSDAYFQTRVEPEHEDLNCFKPSFGGFISKVMLQGDMNAPGTFMRIMSHLMRDYLGDFVWVFIDYILIFSKKEDKHLEHIKKVWRKLKEAHFFASRKKSVFFSPKMNVLGHVVDDDGIHASSEKITRIGEWAAPKERKELREFSGLVNYIRQFLPHIVTITAPLTDLTRNTEFVWTPTHDTAFQNTKRLADDNEVLRAINHESGVLSQILT